MEHQRHGRVGLRIKQNGCALAVKAPEAVTAALQSYRDMICQTVLSDTLTDEAAGGETKDLDLNGQQATVTLRKAD